MAVSELFIAPLAVRLYSKRENMNEK
jgi:hypothetical protein